MRMQDVYALVFSWNIVYMMINTLHSWVPYIYKSLFGVKHLRYKIFGHRYVTMSKGLDIWEYL